MTFWSDINSDTVGHRSTCIAGDLCHRWRTADVLGGLRGVGLLECADPWKPQGVQRVSHDNEQPSHREPDAALLRERRFHLWPAVLVWMAAAGAAAIALWIWPVNAAVAVSLLGCALVAAVAAAWFVHRASNRERMVQRQVRELQAEKQRLQQEREEWERTQAELLARLAEEEEQIEERWRALQDRLLAFHEWLEYPTPIELRSATVADGNSKDTPTAARADADAVAVDGSQELLELAEKDRRVLSLLEEESERLYEKIRRNEFTEDGSFSWTRLRDELYELIVRVARVYKPDAQNPLLETNLEQLLRAGSRVCLHVLVLMESLPVAVHQYDIQQLYKYLRTATKVYGAYRTLRPFWNVARHAWLPGRVLLGGNPLAAAAMWAGSQAASMALKKVTQDLIDRRAIEFLRSLIRVIAYEVAGIYGGDFRYRDANWVYGAELVELAASFPLSRQSLRAALAEVSRLQLRNEYDRVFLYRCLSEHRRPARLLPAAYVLTEEERRRVAEKLEEFFTSHMHGRTESRVRKWREGVQNRLGVRLNVAPKPAGDSGGADTDELRQAAEALAGFLTSVKGLERDELRDRLQRSRTLAGVPSDIRDEWLAGLVARPPREFDVPDLDPDGPLAERFVEDLIDGAVHLPGRMASGDRLLGETLTFLRIPAERVSSRLEAAYGAWFAATLWPEARSDRPPVPVLIAMRAQLEEGEVPVFAYGDVHVACPSPTPAAQAVEQRTRWLVGTDRRLLVLAMGEDGVELEWECRRDRPPILRRVPGRVWDDCRLEGGNLLSPLLPAGTAFELSPGWLGAFDTD
ncbi:MAG: hypothetical protein D6725_08980, partial [Planctomycetota bacterium]